MALDRVRGRTVPLSFEWLLLVRYECSDRVLQPLDGCLQLCKPPVSVVGQRDQHPNDAKEVFPIYVDDEHGCKAKTLALSVREGKTRELRINTLRMLRWEGCNMPTKRLSRSYA